MPSIKKACQCSRTAARISDCILVTSWGRVMEILLMLAQMTPHYGAPI